MTTTAATTTTTTIDLHVVGMMCQGNCGTTVASALQRIDGAVAAQAIFTQQRAWVTIATTTTTSFRQEQQQAAVEAVQAVGFDATVIPDLALFLQTTAAAQQQQSQQSQEQLPPFRRRLDVSVRGMMCQRNCATTVQQALQEAMEELVPTAVMTTKMTTPPPPPRVEVSFAESRATLWYSVPPEYNNNDYDKDDYDKIVLSTALEAIQDVGFEAQPWQNNAKDGTKPTTTTTTTTIHGTRVDLEQGRWQQQQQQDESMDMINNNHGNNNNNNKNNPTFSLSIQGMSCAVCTGRVEAAIRAVAGVEDVTVMLGTQRAAVTMATAADDNTTTTTRQQDKLLFSGGGGGDGGNNNNTASQQQQLAEACQQAVQQAGYTCRIVAENTSLTEHAQQMQQAQQDEQDEWKRLFVCSAAALLPMAVIHYYSHHDHHHDHDDFSSWVSMWIVLLLSTAVQLGVGRRFYQAAYAGWTRGRTLGMDFLIVLGTTASYAYSVVVFVWIMILLPRDKDDTSTTTTPTMEPTFMTSVMLLTFVSLGKWLEAIAKGNTCLALQSLMEMQPATARRMVHAPATAHTGSSDWGTMPTEQVNSTDIVPGDYVKVLPGERLPADGVLVAIMPSALSSSSLSSLATTTASKLDQSSRTSKTQNQAFIDESSFSGEPFAVSKVVGDDVLGGTVNQSAVLLIRVTAAGRDSWLAKIVHLVQDAQRHKAPIQLYADRVAAIFAPIVVAIAAVTLIFWLILPSQDPHQSWQERIFVAVMTAISVVVVACPCALGLATPCAVLVGTGVAAGYGLLIKGGDVLEKMQSVNTVVFDKTGTITSGDAKLSSIETLLATDHAVMQNLPNEVNANNFVLWLACVAELNSEHPIGQAIVDAGKAIWGDDIPRSKHGVSLEKFNAVPGNGVECVLQSAVWGAYGVRVGKREWAKAALREDVVVAPDDDATGDEEVEAMRRRGAIAVYVSFWNCRVPSQKRIVAGVLGVNDPVKPEALSTVRALQQMGIDVWMCTGDSSMTALAVADKVGIRPENVIAGVSPSGKGEMVSELQQEVLMPCRTLCFWKPAQRTVAMVADGVNDAVALAKSDVGFAIGAGTEVAVEAADVVLVKSNLQDVVVALHLSSVVFRRILLNLCCAMAYNVCALPFAAGLFTPFTDFRLPPAAAGFMMAISSVSVVTSSLLLRTYRKPDICEDGKLGRMPAKSSSTSHQNLIRSQKYSGLPSSEIEIV